ncbi:hypothetical protein I4U23_009746 [Adineta vaga]|nr:hypothetical protein I4U23_009746 [Adineta vaga]
MAASSHRVSFSDDNPSRNKSYSSSQSYRSFLNIDVDEDNIHQEDRLSAICKWNVQEIDSTTATSPISNIARKQRSNSKGSDNINETITKQLNERKDSESQNLSARGLFLIPPEIFEILNLRRLILSNNNLAHLSSTICSLVNLEYLDISHNPLIIESDFSDDLCFPQEFSCLKNLQTLILVECNLKHIPAVIWNTTSLQTLDLSGNKVGYISSDIGNLIHIRHLRLCRMNLVTLPAEIGFCDQVQTINLLDNPIDNLPETLIECCQLFELKLNYKRFHTLLDEYIIELINEGKIQSQHIPSVIFELENLRLLDLEETKINFIPIEQTLFNLTELYLSKNSFFAIPESVCMIPQLKILDISSNSIHTLSKQLINLIRLEQLNLSHNKLTILSQLFARLPMLTKLIVSHNQIDTIEKDFLQSQSLLILDLSYNNLRYLPYEFCHFTQLEMLDLRYNQVEYLQLSMCQMIGLKTLNSFNDVLQRTGLHLLGNRITDPPSSIWKSTDIQMLFNYMEMNEKCSSNSFYHLKIIFIGPKNSGKTTFVMKLIQNQKHVLRTRKTLDRYISTIQDKDHQPTSINNDYLSSCSSSSHSEVGRAYPPPLETYQSTETLTNMMNKSTFITKNNLYCTIFDITSEPSFEILYPLIYDSNALYILPINLTNLLKTLQNMNKDDSQKPLSDLCERVGIAIIGLIDNSHMSLLVSNEQTLLDEIHSQTNTFLSDMKGQYENMNLYSHCFSTPIQFNNPDILSTFIQQLETIAQQWNFRHHKYKQQLVQQRLGFYQQNTFVFNYETCFKHFEERNLSASIVFNENMDGDAIEINQLIMQDEINQMSFDECLNYLKLLGDILHFGPQPHSIIILKPDYLINKIFAHTLFRPHLDRWLNYHTNVVFQFSGYYSSEELFEIDRQRLITRGEFTWRMLKVLFYERTSNNIEINELSIVDYCRLMQRLSWLFH